MLSGPSTAAVWVEQQKLPIREHGSMLNGGRP